MMVEDVTVFVDVEEYNRLCSQRKRKMEENWTPGPWRLMPPSPSDYETILSESETFLFDGNRCAQHVAVTTKNFGDDTSSFREGRQHANALLIASAPALYDALKGLLQWFDEPPSKIDDWGVGWFVPANGLQDVLSEIAACRLAIANADGQGQ